MSAYEEKQLAARFAALATEPLAGSWDDVLERAGSTSAANEHLRRRGRRRRVLVAAVALVLATAATTAAFGIVRELILDRSFVGLPPRGAAPSGPESGDLILSFSGRSTRLSLRMNSIFVYADGRVIWIREREAPGLLQQRLTPEAAERLRAEVVSTGLFEEDRALITERAFRGTVRVRNGERLVRVDWVRANDLGYLRENAVHARATPEQERALARVDALLANPAASLPASAFQDRRVAPYVATRYAVCWGHRPEQGPDSSSEALPPPRVLTLLPPDVERTLRRRGFSPRPSLPPKDCAVVQTEEARTLAGALEAGGLEPGEGADRPAADSFSKYAYRRRAPRPHPGHVYVVFEPTLPHGEWICTPCG